MASASGPKHFTLADGRTLAYSEYGAADGGVVFYCHGHPGSGREWPVFDPGDLATDLNLRIIAPDRPGFGYSDFQPHRRILDWPDDVAELADGLDVGRFAVLGISGGGPHAAACAFKISERLASTAIVCGMGPADSPGIADGSAWKFAAGRSPFMRRVTLPLMALGLRKKPEGFAAKMAQAFHGADLALLQDHPEMARAVVDLSFAEAFRQGIAGIDQEATAFAQPWGFKLQDIRGEVHLWHGEQDENVPVSVGHHVADSIPGCSSTFLEDEGHLSLARGRMGEFLATLADSLARPRPASPVHPLSTPVG